jgi:hypothetical protein
VTLWTDFVTIIIVTIWAITNWFLDSVTRTRRTMIGLSGTFFTLYITNLTFVIGVFEITIWTWAFWGLVRSSGGTSDTNIISGTSSTFIVTFWTFGISVNFIVTFFEWTITTWGINSVSGTRFTIVRSDGTSFTLSVTRLTLGDTSIEHTEWAGTIWGTGSRWLTLDTVISSGVTS